MSYDSRPATWEHINLVQSILAVAQQQLLIRSVNHDWSKLLEPELGVFDEYTPRLATTDYGSAEYFESLKGMKPALDHHYAAHSHHPEHYERGVLDMDAIDLLEMCADWIAAGERTPLRDGETPRGKMERVLESQQQRFGYGEEVAGIIATTIRRLMDTAHA